VNAVLKFPPYTEMKIVIGYYDRAGKYLGKKRPRLHKTFYLVMGTVIKKIAEDKEQTPYQRGVYEYNFKYCDKNRMVIEIKKFKNGRLDKSYDRDADYSTPILLIGNDLGKKKYGYYSRKLKIDKNLIRLK